MGNAFLEKRLNTVTKMAEEKKSGIPLPVPGVSNSSLLESLAELEHTKWVRWAKAALEKEGIADSDNHRWRAFFVPYRDLPEGIKEYSRANARQTLLVIGDFFKNNT